MQETVLAAVVSQAATELDAKEFGVQVKQRGWRLGLLVARNVERGKGQSERVSRRRNHDDEKISADKFAELADTSADRVLRYLEAWERAADKGLVPYPDGLKPGEELSELEEVASAHLWATYYRAPSRASSGSGSRQLNEPAKIYSLDGKERPTRRVPEFQLPEGFFDALDNPIQTSRESERATKLLQKAISLWGTPEGSLFMAKAVDLIQAHGLEIFAGHRARAHLT